METFHQDGPRGCSWRSVIGVALVLVAAAGATAAETVNLATGEVGILGSVTAGDFTATATLDGTAEKIAENKDEIGRAHV